MTSESKCPVAGGEKEKSGGLGRTETVTGGRTN